MNKVIIWIVALIIIAGGGYYLYTTGIIGGAGAAQGQNATSTADVVQAQDVTLGTGAEAKPGTIVSVLYIGKLTDGTVFDSSEAHGNQPLVFALGTEGLIPGFQIGINGMKEGGERVLAVPPSFGYGAEEVKDATGKVVIPANSTIIFNVKLVKVEQGTTTPTAQ